MKLDIGKFSNFLVTGGAGFIGSHFVDRLVQTGCFVRVVDNLSGGRLGNLESGLNRRNFEFVQGDLKDLSVAEKMVDGVEVVLHLAANPEVRVAEVDPSIHFRENLLTTFNILEAMRKNETARLVVFFSSSAVYGEPEEFPTPENQGSLSPISIYGASKLGCESLISAYSRTFGIRGLVLRLANVVGRRSTHGVIVDFIRKLQNNHEKLEILGDGSQCKSYLHIDDCVDAVLEALRHFLNEEERAFEVFNVGPLDNVAVKRVAEIVAEEMGLKNASLRFTGGVDGGRGWRGDVKTMLLSVDKLLDLGWRPKVNSEQAVRLCCRELLHANKTAAGNARKIVLDLSSF